MNKLHITTYQNNSIINFGVNKCFSLRRRGEPITVVQQPVSALKAVQGQVSTVQHTPTVQQVHITDKKLLHRINCSENLNLIRNVIIPEIIKGCENETVLIEFRPLPHLEFLIRNTIIKLPQWSHTCVCGNVNYTFIKSICDTISNNINIIHFDIDNLTPSDYSKLLMTKEFWLNFTGEKLLIYQEDTMLFDNQIDEFLKYDYIGAAWPSNQDDNDNGVGNGGFSLRSKSKMIECIEKVKPTDLKLGGSTLNYMKNTNSYILPEDVYFSKSLIDYKLGVVAERDAANRFSQETQLCNNPLGGHNFWLAKDNTLKVASKFILHTEYYKNVTHRGGWKTIIKRLIDNGIVYDANGNSDANSNSTNNASNTIKFIDCLEARFVWDTNSKPLSEDWVGVIHYSPHLPSFLKHNLDMVLNSNALLKSLDFCKGLIVLSQNNLNYIKQNSKFKNIKIINLKHPIEYIKNKFSLDNFVKNKKYSVIQLGLQDRKVTTIYTLKTRHNKIWLPGTINEQYKNRLNDEQKYLKLNINLKDVSVERYEEHSKYDSMLQNNIVIIPLWNASANNSILESIEMNIPAFVTRIPASEEYLGKDYPMFFTENYEIEEIINNIPKLHKKYTETYTYLCKMDKSDLSLTHFNSELVKFLLMS